MSSNAPVVRIVDDDEAMLKSWKFLIEGEGWNIRVYNSAKDFLAKDNPEDAGCLVLDVRMPDMTGIELQHAMLDKENFLPIIFVSAHGDIDMAVQSMKDGAVDFLPKPVEADRLLTAIEKAVILDLKQRDKKVEVDKARAAYNNLTPREKYIARLIGHGYQNREISYQLNISEKTVQFHRGSISKKLQTRNSADITKLLMTIKEI